MICILLNYISSHCSTPQAATEQARSSSSAGDERPTTTTLFNTIRDWVSERKEGFTLMELEDEPVIRDLAMAMASQVESACYVS